MGGVSGDHLIKEVGVLVGFASWRDTVDKNQKYTWGWLGFFAAFMGADLLAAKTQKAPTFSRVITKALPWWIVVPAAGVLFIHMIDMYRDDASDGKR